MTISLENLELIPKLLDEIKALKLNITNEKKWLTANELSSYIGYSIESIHKMVKENVFIDGIHYYQPSKKLLFDKKEIDNWVIGFKSDRARQNVNLVVNELLANII